jgi:hypothetical protein
MLTVYTLIIIIVVVVYAKPSRKETAAELHKML